MLTENQRGALFMTASMAGFAVEDVFVKAAAQSLPLGQVLLTIGLAGMLVRSGFEIVGRLLYPRIRQMTHFLPADCSRLRYIYQ